VRATRSWRAHGLSSAWRAWRARAEARLRLMDADPDPNPNPNHNPNQARLRLMAATAAAVAAVRRWRLRDAAVGIEAWAAEARSRELVTI